MYKTKERKMTTYNYKMGAYPILVLKNICYKREHDICMNSILLSADQPIKKDDFLDPSCYRYSICEDESIPDEDLDLEKSIINRTLLTPNTIQETKILSDEEEKDLKDLIEIVFIGFKIDRLMINYNSEYTGRGSCRVFYYLRDRIINNTLESSESDSEFYTGILKKFCERDELDFWQQKIPNWNEFQSIGNINEIIW